MKIAITGASGPFGAGVTRTLVKRYGIEPRDLILVSRDPGRLSEWAALGADTRQGDFDDRGGLVAALQGADRMLMISTNRVGQREPQHRNAVDAAKAAGVRHVAYTSFVGAPGTVSIALADHRFTEGLLRESGMAWTFLRNSQYTEAMRDAGGPAAIRSGQWLSSSGGGRIAMVTRDDCIAAAAAVMAGTGHEGQTYDITGPELIAYAELARLFSEMSGRPIAYSAVDDEGMYAFFDSLGIPRTAQDDHVVDGFGWCSEDMVSFEATIRQGGFAVLSDHVQRLTGRAPESAASFLMRHKDQILAAAAAQG
ncbi:MAG TPA: SDR family oxidoreductase [Ideonella sp.]|nr:SDR family oxidoreductase [Ideonella sp.]